MKLYTILWFAYCTTVCAEESNDGGPTFKSVVTIQPLHSSDLCRNGLKICIFYVLPIFTII